MAELVRVKDKYQVTIPAEIRAVISIQTGDYLEASAFQGGILLRPKRVSDPQGASSPTILDFLRTSRAVQRTKSDIDAALNSQRDAW
jgi:AbrB family looped-hinge helix DNA binding protein